MKWPTEVSSAALKAPTLSEWWQGEKVQLVFFGYSVFRLQHLGDGEQCASARVAIADRFPLLNHGLGLAVTHFPTPSVSIGWVNERRDQNIKIAKLG